MRAWMSNLGLSVAVGVVVAAGVNEPRANGGSPGELATAHRVVLGFTVGLDSLDDVERKLGSAELYRDTSRGDVIKGRCYRSNRESDSTVVRFESAAVGGWREVNMITVARDSSQVPPTAQCSAVEAVTRRLATASGVRLGMTRQQVRQVLGGPGAVSGDDLTYDYKSRRKLTVQERRKLNVADVWASYLVMSAARFRFADNALASFEIYWALGE